MNLFKKWLIISVILLFSTFCFAQTVHQVAAGDSTLAAAIADALDGDIIELVTDGGLYTNPNQIIVDKNLEIRAHADLVNKPILKYVGTSTGAYMFKIESSPKVKFMGLEFDGDGTAEGGAAMAKYALRLDNGDTLGTMNVRVDDCVMHDFSEKIIKPYPLSGIDSLIVHNSIFYNGAKEGIVFYSGSTSDPAVEMKYAEVYNCTFYNIVREAIKGDTNPDTKILVDQCTFYDIGGLDKPFIYVDDALDVVVKNSIFQKNLETGNFIRLENAAGSFVSNVVYWDVFDIEIDNATVTDTLFADPLFLDPANGDFTLDMNSQALYFADDGNAAGDLRWDPTLLLPKTHTVEAGIDVIKPLIDAAKAGDIIEFVSSGGSYLSSDQFVIDKDLTFRAREGLAEKPIIKYVGASTGAYMFKIESSPKVKFMGLEFDGDGTAEGGAAMAKYALRLDNGDTLGTMNVRVDDCVMHDFSEKIIKPYPLSGIDSLIVHNSIFYNGAKEGIVFYSGSTSDPAVEMKYAEVYNCTFYNIVREAIKGDTNPDTKILVDQCTFYDIGGLDKPFIYVDDALDVVVKNSIFQKNLETGNFIRLENAAGSFVSNVVYWDVFDIEIDNATVTDTLFADPLFLDPANGDFTLGATSLARTYGPGGTPIGDLRWAIDPNAVILSVVTNGQGIVTLDPSGNIYSPGTEVTLTATADLGWEFKGWSGDVAPFPPNQNPTTVTINSNITAIATFENLTPQVSLTIDSIGLGTVVVNPLAGDDGTYDQGETVELTAVAAPDWEFVEWLGDVTGTANPLSFNVDSNMVVTASYQSTLTQFALNVNVVGKGSYQVDPVPVITTYDTNMVVVLTAMPAIGWTFNSWSGDLVSTTLVDSVVMDSDKNLTLAFDEEQVPGGVLVIDDSWDLMDAVDFANNNSTVNTLELTTSGGIYTTLKSGTVEVKAPLNIMAAEGLADKPIITNTNIDGVNGTIDILRVYDHIMLKGVIIDGSTDYSAGMKYAVRYSNSSAPDTVKWGSNAIFEEVDFRHLYDDGSEKGDGHAFKLDVNMILGTVKFENCTFNDIGYEAIRISDTEKWLTDRALDSLIVRNCTFTNIDAEGIRYYSDLDPTTPDAPVIIEHVTFNNSATRTMYLKNSGGAIVRDLIIANTRMSGHGRDGDLMDSQGSDGNTNPSLISHIDTFNVGSAPLKAGDGIIDTATIYGFNPEFEDPDNMNYTLLANSPLYGLAHDGTALGDLNWATNEPVGVDEIELIPLEFSIAQNYPNPFNPTTTIKFGIPVDAKVSVKIFNSIGQQVARLVDGEALEAGYHQKIWNAKNDNGNHLASGFYIYRIDAIGKNGKEFAQSMKMIFLK